jgi:hypothetical protein
MPGSAKTTNSPAAAKTSRPVTLKHLAAALAEEHQLTKRACEAVLGDLVGTITKHLKKGERIRIVRGRDYDGLEAALSDVARDESWKVRRWLSAERQELRHALRHQRQHLGRAVRTPHPLRTH